MSALCSNSTANTSQHDDVLFDEELTLANIVYALTSGEQAERLAAEETARLESYEYDIRQPRVLLRRLSDRVTRNLPYVEVDLTLSDDDDDNDRVPAPAKRARRITLPPAVSIVDLTKSDDEDDNNNNNNNDDDDDVQLVTIDEEAAKRACLALVGLEQRQTKAPAFHLMPNSSELLRKRVAELLSSIAFMHIRISQNKMPGFNDPFWAQIFPQMRAGSLSKDNVNNAAVYEQTSLRVRTHMKAMENLAVICNHLNFDVKACHEELRSRIGCSVLSRTLTKRCMLSYKLLCKICRELYAVC